MSVLLVVPDASVILKWVLPSDGEPDADKALVLRNAILEEDVRALVPTLWIYEVGNTVATVAGNLARGCGAKRWCRSVDGGFERVVIPGFA